MLLKLLQFADYFLPSTFHDRESRPRARTAIFMFLISTAFLIFSTTLTLLNATLSMQQAAIFSAVVSMQILCLFTIRKTHRVEDITLIYLALLALVVCLDTVFVAKSLFMPALQVYPLFLLLGFFISSRWQQKMGLFVWLVVCSLACYIALAQSGFTVPYGLDAATFVRQLSVSTITRAALTLFCVNFYVRVKSIAEAELEQEQLWQMQSLKLAEISLITQLMAPRLREPLKAFSTQLQAFKNEPNLATPEYIQKMKRHVEEMTRIARGTSWIYKAYRNESVGRISSHKFHEQLQFLLEGKIALQPPHITFTLNPVPDSILEGPLPSVLLLILSFFEELLNQNLNHSHKQRFILETLLDHPSTLWRIRHELIPSDSKSHENLGLRELDSATDRKPFRTDLIRDLIESSQAKVSEYREGGEQIIEIRGEWNVT
ncbi:MAG: hypothetical protein EOP10_11430 [Proteobacteria bacterium]|nr:MAG: hypothetical protein EOP10_11430 [Pseudomonadota bacterium]